MANQSDNKPNTTVIVDTEMVERMARERRHMQELTGACSDPHGKAPNEAGAKLDSGKNRLGLVLLSFSRALQEVSKVGTFGANKYSDNGWISVPNGEKRYTDAMMRHLFAEAAGERCDPESGILHAAHAAWNALARLDLALRNEEKVTITVKTPY